MANYGINRATTFARLAAAMPSTFCSEISLDLGTYRRFDGEMFELAGLVRETAQSTGFWSIVFSAQHKSFGEIKISALVNKASFPQLSMALSLAKGDLVERVKAMLDDADSTARPLRFSEQPGAWVIIGLPIAEPHSPVALHISANPLPVHRNRPKEPINTDNCRKSPYRKRYRIPA